MRAIVRLVNRDGVSSCVSDVSCVTSVVSDVRWCWCKL